MILYKNFTNIEDNYIQDENMINGINLCSYYS